VLLNGLLHLIVEAGDVDEPFIRAHTEGWDAMPAFLAPYTPARVAELTGLAEADVRTAARWIGEAGAWTSCWTMGLNQSTHGTWNTNALCNLHLATGAICRRGAGPFSLTGQPNAMGGREVGGLANQLAAHMDFAPAHVERVGRFWGAARMATKPGLKAVELFDAVERGAVKALWIMATNPVVSMPDAERVRRALRGCRLVVVSDCVRDTDTTRCAHVLLPAAAWGEKSGTVTNSERRVSRQRGFMPLPGEAQPDWWIVAQVARRMGFRAAFARPSPTPTTRRCGRSSGRARPRPPRPDGCSRTVDSSRRAAKRSSFRRRRAHRRFSPTPIIRSC
jgi:assimilatory nitrate reductase catalytic subunit